MAHPESGYVAVLIVDLHFPEAGSLKAKRKELQSIRAILHGRFGAAVAETAFHDLWQRAQLTVALCSGSMAHLEASVDRITEWLDARCASAVRVEQMYASAADLRDVVSTLERGR